MVYYKNIQQLQAFEVMWIALKTAPMEIANYSFTFVINDHLIAFHRGNFMINLIFSILMSTQANAQITAQPSSYDFGQVQVGWTSTYGITIRNNSEKPTGSFFIQNSCYEAFNVYSNCSGNLAPHGSCYLTVRFNPPFDNSYYCSINVRSDNGYANIYVSGRGYKPN